MEQQQDQYVDFKSMTNKQLANIVTHTTGIGMKADFTNSEDSRNWARYYAVVKSGRISPVTFRKNLKIKGDREEKKEKA